jgi:hypothetical protein
MRKFAFIGLAAVALSVTALPALADDQSISLATGAIGSAAPPTNVQHAQPTRQRNGAVQSAAPSPYGAYAQDSGYAQSGGYDQRNCTYIGGPKGNNLTCW